MRAGVLLAGLVAISIVILADPASAKPAVKEATISGPGLDGVIRIQHRDTGVLYEAGIDLGRRRARANSVEQLGLTPTDLGPRYLVTYRFQSSDALIEQNLYPYARGGPVTYVEPDQELWGGGKPVGHSRLVSRPVRLLPLPRRPRPAGEEPRRRGRSRSAARASRMQSALGPWIVVALVGLAALTLATLAMGRRVIPVRR